jgi:hypothetical protein
MVCTWTFVVVALLLLVMSLSGGSENYEGQVVKGNRNALYLVRNGQRAQFPDFYTFTQMGYNMSVIRKIPDADLNSIPLGSPVSAIAVYRPEDFMYHRLCSDPDRLVSTTARSIAHVICCTEKSLLTSAYNRCRNWV